MHESLRQQALKAMGVSPLLPRFRLAGAKPSQRLDASHSELECDAADMAQPSHADAATATDHLNHSPVDNNVSIDAAVERSESERSATLSQLLEQNAVAPPSVSNSENDETTLAHAAPSAQLDSSTHQPAPAPVHDSLSDSSGDQKPIGKQAAVEAFQYWFWQFDNLLFVLDLSVFGADQNSKRMLYRFLSDVFYACDTWRAAIDANHKAKAFKPRFIESSFNWPPTPKMPAAVNANAMLEATLSSFLQTLAEQQAFDYGIVFAAHAVCKPEPDLASPDAYQAFELLNKPMLLVNDVASYFDQPEQKARLWQAIRQQF